MYVAFGDKRALFVEALDRYVHTYGAFTERSLAEASGARDGIERLLRSTAAAYTRPDRPQGCMLISATTNCSPQSADVAAHVRDIRGDGAAGLAELSGRARGDRARAPGSLGPAGVRVALAHQVAVPSQGRRRYSAGAGPHG